MQDVARATAQVDQAQVIFDNHTIRAPMAGTVLVLNVDPGQSIDTATILMTIADLDDLIVEADVDEAYPTETLPAIPADWTDTSLRNDTSPSWQTGRFHIWVDYPDPQ